MVEREFGVLASLAALSGAGTTTSSRGDALAALRPDQNLAAAGVQADNAGPAAPVQDGSAEESAPSFGGLEEAGAAYVHRGESVPTISVEDALVAEAEKAIRDGEYLCAAECFADAAKLAPDRVDYVMMRGHCLKDGGDFPGAFRAYAAALDAAPSGDPHIQLGHLFKITGNLNEARLAYGRGARLSEAVGILELHNLGSISAAEFRLPAAAGAGAVPIELFFEVAGCDRDDAFNHAAIVAAGKSLAAAGAPDIAKAFFEVAYLGDDAGAYRREHYAIVQRFALWPAIHFSELARASAVRAAQRPLTVRARLNKLMAATLAAQGDDADDEAQSPPVSPRTPDWPPEILTADVGETLLKRLMGALDRAYHVFSTQTQLSGAAAIEAVRALDSATHPFDHVVSFPLGGTAADLRLAAARVLNAIVRRWLSANASRFLSPFIRPEHVEADLSSGRPRLSDLVAELGSATAVFDEVDAQLLRPPRAGGSPNPPIDRFFAQLFAAGAAALSEDQIGDFLRESIRRRLPNASAVLAWSLAAAGAATHKIIDFAQKLKSAGYSEFAYAFMNASRDEAQAPRDFLVEKALLAKIVGDFANSARLFETVAATDLLDMFPRQELAAILPEIEPVASILDRLRADPLFWAVARERRVFRTALGEEDVDFDDALFDNETRIFDLAPEMASEFAPHVERPLREEIEVLEVGRQKRIGLRGETAVLSGCDFVRARVYSRRDIVKLRARIDGKTVAVTTPTPLPAREPSEPIQAWMANCWMDLSTTTPGRHELQLYFEERGGGYRSREFMVWVAPSPARPDSRPSPSIVDLPADTAGLTVEERVRRLPSLVLSADRRFFKGEFENILVIRADQLGDVVMSLAAMFKLRDLFPNAQLSCLAAPSNRDLLLSTGLFHEVLAAELTHDPLARRRYASLSEQLRLRTLLRSKRYDLAVDLQAGADSRPLLRLAGARYTAGFSPAEFPWLSFGVDIRTRAADSGKEGSPQSARPVALVDALASVLRHRSFHLPNLDVDVGLLQSLGLEAGRGFAVLHSGARTASRKWPFANYLALAGKIVEQHGLQAALLADSPADAAGVDLAASVSRDLKIIAHRLSFSEFDALLSRCAVFVGNDTGPKHVAALRGAPVVSIHMGAVPWEEWGQDGSGFIVTRRAPCYGCGIEEVADCGKGLSCLVDITVDEVFGAVRQALKSAAREDAASHEQRTNREFSLP
jgi:ADP-heptose:LPS heptosyltransferase/tetratricopeptide (TPR) repeat protein